MRPIADATIRFDAAVPQFTVLAFGEGHPAPRREEQRVSLRPVVRRILLAAATLLLMTVAWTTLSGGLRQIPQSRTLGQRIETTVQLACGLLSLLSVLTCFRWRRWGPPVRSAWAVSLATAAGFSSLVWGPPSLSVGLVFAAGALLLALAIIRLLRTGLAA